MTNDPGGERDGAIAELLRLQSEFQARLADETLRYLRSLQGVLGPASPGTLVVADGSPVTAAGTPGSAAQLRVEVENRQEVHAVVRPALSALVAATGTTWLPASEADPLSGLVPPKAVRDVVVRVEVPAGLPPDTYRGALFLQGFRGGGIPVAVTVQAPAEPADGGAAGAPA